MPILRINEFPEGSGVLTNDDVFIFMDDPSGSGVTKKISLSEISAAIGGGGSANTGDIVFNGSTISTSDENGSVTISASGNQWSFNSDGTVSLPSNILDAGSNTIDIKSSNYAELWYVSGPSGTQNGYNWVDNPLLNKECYVWASSTGGGIQNYREEDGTNPGWNHAWNFRNDGELQIPGNILLNNGTSLAKGTFDNGTSGQNGISLNCAVGYELNWQGGHLKSTADGGLTSSNILCDSPIEFPGSGTYSVKVDNEGIRFVDGSVQKSKHPTVIQLGNASGTINTNASLGDIFDINLMGSGTLATPSNPTDGQSLRWRITHKANNIPFVLGSGFNVPSSATSPLPFSSTSGTMDLLAATYDLDRNKWDVIAFIMGY